MAPQPEPGLRHLALPRTHTGPRGTPLPGQHTMGATTMAQHLLAAADRFELPRLRAICEKHLCETVDIANAATTLTLAEENHATELKRHCLEFVAQNLSSVMVTSGFEYMIQRCPNLQRSILEACSKDMSLRLSSPDGNGKGVVRSRQDWADNEALGQPGSSSKGERRVRFRLK